MLQSCRAIASRFQHFFNWVWSCNLHLRQLLNFYFKSQPQSSIFCSCISALPVAPGETLPVVCLREHYKVETGEGACFFLLSFCFQLASSWLGVLSSNTSSSPEQVVPSPGWQLNPLCSFPIVVNRFYPHQILGTLSLDVWVSSSRSSFKIWSFK